MKIHKTTITPEIAASMLERNTKNRPLNKRHVAKLAADMRSGAWLNTGDPIRFSNQRLIDGQHRLMAIVESGKSFEFVVIYELDDDVFPAIDRGRRRYDGDILFMGKEGLGPGAAKSIAAALKVVARYDAGAMYDLNRGSEYSITELFDRYPNMERSTSLCHHSPLLAPSVIAGLHYVFSRIDPNAADKFVTDLMSGFELSKDDPVAQLRNRLITNKSSSSRLTLQNIAALVIRAWNVRRKGGSALRHRNEDPFPVAR